MNVEVVAIGTELLLGQITNTNAAWIGEQLALHGFNHHRQVTVGDNLDRMVDAIGGALASSDAVIVTGGLGPTQDDVTREAIAAVAGVGLEEDDEMVERIIEMFASRGRRMPMNNLRQAQRPVGSSWIAELPGTAPGLVCPVGDKVIYAVPGVPWEMKEMVSGTVLSDLQQRSGVRSVILSRTLKTWGSSESGLAELLADRFAALEAAGNPTIAFLASGIDGLKVRITAKAETEDEARRLLDAEAAFVEERIGEWVFGYDDDTIESVVLGLLGERGWTVATAESLTGGLVASRLTTVPGASATVRGGVVAYDPEVKFSVLGVDRGPVISEAAALAMAEGVRRVTGADVGLAATGVAGPDQSEGLRPGTVCLAVVTPDAQWVDTVQLPGGRTQVREYSCITLLGALRRVLVGEVS